MDVSSRIRWLIRTLLVDLVSTAPFRDRFRQPIPREISARVAAEQLLLLHKGTPAAGLATALAACVVAAMLWGSVPTTTLLVWAAGLAAIGLGQVASYVYLLVTRNGSELVPSDLVPLFALCFLEAAIWGSSIFIFSPEDPRYRDLLTLALCLVAAGAALFFSIHLPGLYLYEIPLLGTLALGLALQGERAYIVLSIGVLVLLAGFLVFGRNFNRLLSWALLASAQKELLVDELQKQKLAADRANAAKTRFLAAASHDLRQPMQAIAVLTSVVAQRSRPQELEVISKLSRSVSAMEELMSGLLDISRLDAGVVKANVVPVQLNSLFENIRHTFFPQINGLTVRLNVRATQVCIETDPVIMLQMISNLVANAVKFTRQGGILVACRRRSGQAVIEVWDTGIGIPLRSQEDVFQEFVQLDNPERDRSKGLGLGLSIVKRSAELLGHKLTCSSVMGKGSCFRLFVTMSDRYPMARNDPVVDGNEKLVGAFVVLIENDNEVRSAVEELLKLWGCHSVCVGSTDEALRALRDHIRVPDVILTDFRLKGLDNGVEAIREVRRAFDEEIPAVVLTGEISADELGRLHDAGLPVLHKPVSASKLAATLAEAIPVQQVVH